MGRKRTDGATDGAPAEGARRGIEQVLLRAGFDRRFRGRLLRDRAGTLDSCGVVLTPSERAVLLVAAPIQLDAMAAGVARSALDRRSWFARVAAVFGVFIGGGLLAASQTSCNVIPVCTGIRPESEPDSSSASDADALGGSAIVDDS